jgi:hypothetical protein
MRTCKASALPRASVVETGLPIVDRVFLLSRSLSEPRTRALDAAVIAAFVAYSVVMWWPTRNLPYYWDGACLVVEAAHEMLIRGFLPLVPGANAYYAHPPLFIAGLALVWRIFGESRVVATRSSSRFFPWR